jgi:hypothetical protein
MMNIRFYLPLALFTGLTSAAQAQSPLDPQAPVPALRYTSSLSTYRPVSDWHVGSWREANERVGRIGGWRVYQREAISAGAMPTETAR